MKLMMQTCIIILLKMLIRNTIIKSFMDKPQMKIMLRNEKPNRKRETRKIRTKKLNKKLRFHNQSIRHLIRVKIRRNKKLRKHRARKIVAM